MKVKVINVVPKDWGQKLRRIKKSKRIGGLLVPEGLYSPVAMYYVTSLKYGYVFNCSGKIRNSYQN